MSDDLTAAIGWECAPLGRTQRTICRRLQTRTLQAAICGAETNRLGWRDSGADLPGQKGPQLSVPEAPIHALAGLPRRLEVDAMTNGPGLPRAGVMGAS
jgi:hypothetical protein